MRLIDAAALTEGLELHRKSTDQKYETDRQWAVGYNAGLDRALYSIAYAKTITMPPNPPLTLAELQEMDGEPVWVYILNHEMFADKRDDFGGWGMCRKSWVRVWDSSRADMVRIDYEFESYGRDWLAYRRKPEEGPA